jgi:hypothetical protein
MMCLIMLALENEARIGKSKRKNKKRNRRFTASGTSKLPGEWSDLGPNTLLPQASRFSSPQYHR